MSDPTPQQLAVEGQRTLDRIALGLPYLTDKPGPVAPKEFRLYHRPWRRPRVVECIWCGAGRTPAGFRMCTPECPIGVDPRLHW